MIAVVGSVFRKDKDCYVMAGIPLDNHGSCATPYNP